jgi:hypothetical protein
MTPTLGALPTICRSGNDQMNKPVLSPFRFKNAFRRHRSLIRGLTAMGIAISGLLGTACTTVVEYPVITKNSVVSREKTILVMGIQWVDRYNDAIGDGEIKVLRSEDLLSDQKLLARNRHHRDQERLTQPLHYLANIRLEFSGPDQVRHQIVRYNRDLKTYPTLAVHEFLPGTDRYGSGPFR